MTRLPHPRASWWPATVVVLLLLASGACRPRPVPRPAIAVFAAASLREVLGELERPCGLQAGTTPVFNFAGSNILAQQIKAANGADLFLSANERWMDFLEQEDRLLAGTRRDLISNRLVVITRKDNPLSLNRLEDLATADFPELVLADPEGVPAGIYARQVLEAATVDGTSLWQRLSPKVVPAADVYIALVLVAARPNAAGIVYASDARTSREVRVVLDVPPELTPPIRYSAAVVRGGIRPEAAQRFLDCLSAPPAQEVFTRYGFLPLPASPAASGPG